MKILVANRGEIACRVLHTLRTMAIASVAVYTDPDVDAPHVWLADEAVPLGAADQYLNIEAIINAATEVGATAIHPGYGFLSENSHFARACRTADITFIGPSPESMESLGDKRAARQIAEEVGVPVVPGAQEINSIDDARRAADGLGYPILLKAAGGGGGKGMRPVAAAAEMEEAFAAAQREARSAFADERLLVEKLIQPARHVEVQILADGRHAIALGERECSLQRRYQKVIEESPSNGISESTRTKLCDAAVAVAEAANYASAGTVEFLVGSDGEFYFLEVNTRLQVEHPVTEMRCGLDLVQEQIGIAFGATLPTNITMRGHPIEARLYAEDPYDNYLPSTGDILMLEWPNHPYLRIDSGIQHGGTVHPYYDPMLAKMIAWGSDRTQATKRLIDGLRATVILGVKTNQSFLLDILNRDFFTKCETYTTTLESNEWLPPEPPEEVRIALRESGTRGLSTHGDSLGDRHSPWQTLGPYRMSL